MKVYFATTNLKKLKELREILGVDLTQMNKDKVEIQGTMEQIVEYKLTQAIPFIREDEAVIVDDTGASIDALGGFPGVYIKDFLGIGLPKIMEIVTKIGNNRMTAFCRLGIAHYANGRLIRNIFPGECKGRIVGSEGVLLADFNGICLPDGSDKRFGEMLASEKNKISHRGVAGRKLAEYMRSARIIKDSF